MDLWLNGKVVLQSFKIYQGGRHMSSGDMVLWLKTGDKVWLQAANGTTGMSTKSFFSGHMLYGV